MTKIQMTFLLVGGHEISSDVAEFTAEELEALRDGVKEFLKDDNGGGYFSVDPFTDTLGRSVESIINVRNVSAVQIVEAED